MVTVTDPVERLDGVTIVSTVAAHVFKIEPSSDDELTLVPQGDDLSDEPGNERTLSLKSLDLNLRRGEYYFPKQAGQDRFNEVRDAASDL